MASQSNPSDAQRVYTTDTLAGGPAEKIQPPVSLSLDGPETSRRWQFLDKWQQPYFRRGWNDAKNGVDPAPGEDGIYSRAYRLYPNKGRHGRGWNARRRALYADGYHAGSARFAGGIE